VGPTRRPPASGASEGAEHPRLHLNEAIHQPVRLSVLSLLANARQVDFAFLRDHLGLKDANLSQHLAALEALGYVTIEKTVERKRPRTWVSLSAEGRAAFEEYLETLRQIVGFSPPAPDA
jgi:DNA-binding MarR family transcriptional regulator